MPPAESTEPASSNWDFTTVFDLLRSPIVVGGPAAAAVCHPESTGPLPLAKGQTSNDGDGIASGQAADLKLRRSYTQLGDFGSLWDLLGQATDPGTAPEPSQPRFAETSTKQAPTVIQRPSKKESYDPGSPKSISVSNASQPRVSKDHVAGRPARVSTHPEAVTIKPADTPTAAKDIPLQTPPRAIACDTLNDTPKAKPKPRGGKGTRTKTKDNLTWSESSTEADSDSSTIIFDRPLPKESKVLAFVPSQVGTPDARHEHDATPPSSLDEQDSALNSDTATLTASGVIRVRPTTYKSATDRRVGLMTKLLKEFPDYANIVSQVGRAATPGKHSVKSRPIHVFVDMSNIMVGFHDAVKVSRNIPVTTRIRRVHMCFTNLSMILERGRPTAKRVLVGSDRLPSIDEAEKLGYETNILDRVHKVKHTSQLRTQSRKAPGLAPAGSAGPETAGAFGERWVEQGVDEILHLKILESLLDTDEPATIVLATGDAAEAEYSGGFMRMVERALRRGWAVELVSFSQVTSSAYRKKDFRAQWGSRFRVVELDAYVEELFD